MTRALLFAFAVAVIAVPVRAESPSVDFDDLKLDAKAVLATAKAAAKEDKTQVGDFQSFYTRNDRDCATFRFEPTGPSVSPEVSLRSTEYIEECRWVGDPRHGGHRECWERPGWTYREQVRLEIVNRQAVLPWERETFRVCLEGRWLDFDTVASAYDYQVRGNGGYFTLVPGAHRRMNPDAAGIMADAPANAAGGMALRFNDRWASYYGAGEKTNLKAELWEAVPNWFDKKVADASGSFQPGAEYALSFPSAGLKAGKKYYAKWSFQRLGKVSKDTWMDRGETGQTVYQPSFASFGFAGK